MHMKFALFTLTIITLTGCTNTLYTHRADFSPSKPKGPWNDLYQDARDVKDPSNPGKRPLFGHRKPFEK
jgi:hypothetical protein